jgi:hypothetical protein
MSMPEENRSRFAGFERFVLLVLAIAVITMTAFIFCGVREIKTALADQSKSLAQSANASREAQRAYIYVTGTDITAPSVANSNQAQFSPKWENGGNTPANPVFIEIRCPVKLEKPQEVTKKAMDTPEGQTLQAPPQPVTRLRAMFAPKQNTPIGACIFTKEQLALLLPYKPHVYLAVRAVYHDVFDGSQMHITEYCSDNAVVGEEGHYGFQSGLCPDYNCVDGQCPADDIKEMEQQYFRPPQANSAPNPASN